MSRKRITITLKDEILRQLDAVVDGRTIRNRSHAVEQLLSQSLMQKPIKALILAGGKGVSFSHLSSEMPKALLPINGKPLLEHTLERLKTCNVTDIVISVGAGGQKIKDYFRNGSRWDLKITYLDQQSGRKGTAQPVRQAQELFSQGTFLMLYGDVLTDINYMDLLDFHRSQTALVATMALTSVERVSMWGVARLVGSRIVEFEEKPKNPKTHSHLVNAGIYVAEPSIFRFINPEAVKLESDVFPRLAEEGKLGGYAYDGAWFDVSDQQVYQKVLTEAKTGTLR
jgi:NDP-sugar pyrophosphorylase family protein